MKTVHHSIINQELYSLLNSHLDEISRFGVSAKIQSQEILEQITNNITQLLQMTQNDPENCDGQYMKQAAEYLHPVELFFHLTHFNNVYADTSNEIARIYKEIRHWYDSVLDKLELPINEVWETIYPVSPDSLTSLGHNRYEAYWASPVPMMDIEILRGTEGIKVVDETIHNNNIALGLTLRFSIEQ